MTNEQAAAMITAFILANSAAVFAVGRFFVSRAIEYTHLVRDVKELQVWRAEQKAFNEKNDRDMKGLSMKIERRTPDKGPI